MKQQHRKSPQGQKGVSTEVVLQLLRRCVSGAPRWRCYASVEKKRHKYSLKTKYIIRFICQMVGGEFYPEVHHP